jgi:2-keto-4-pentenoate hydratase/2-oxohepta-3-ene-1,7-dioic acid hydratase in catechol pathway
MTKYLNAVNGNRIGLAFRTEDGIVYADTLRKITGRSYGGINSIDDLCRDSENAKLLAGDIAKNSNRLDTATIGDEGVKHLPCVLHPGKIVCIGLNYRKHALETHAKIPDYPVIFSKFSDAVAAHKQDIPIKPDDWKVDYEAELGILIGREAINVSRKDALKFVFGYFPANDVSARELQLRTSQWLLGKTCPGFAPVGPEVVTADELAAPDNLRIRCFVNGEMRQNSNTSDMIFKCDEIISYCSQYFALEPGDIILTGTPEGVVLGMKEGERKWIVPGDRVEVKIECMATLENSFTEIHGN